MATKRRVNARGATLRPIIGVAEFAETMGISVHCARNWIYQRRIASVKLGKLLCVPTTEVERLVAENLRPAKPRPPIPKSESERILLRGTRPRKGEDCPAGGAQAFVEDSTLPQVANGLNRFKGPKAR